MVKLIMFKFHLQGVLGFWGFGVLGIGVALIIISKSDRVTRA